MCRPDSPEISAVRQHENRPGLSLCYNRRRIQGGLAMAVMAVVLAHDDEIGTVGA